MPDSCIIAVDTGTTSLRAVLFSACGAILHRSQVHNPPSYLPGGLVEQAADTWGTALRTVLAASAAYAQAQGLAVAALALTGFRSAVIPADRDGHPLHPAIMWQDARTAPLCASMASQSAAAFAHSGLPITPICSAIKMRWLRENRPDIAQRTAKMLGVQDYLMHQLTGGFVTDRSLASRTNLYDLDSRDWHPDLLALFGIPREWLCDLVDPGEVAGTLAPGMAVAVGLPAGLPVVSAGGDQQCAALGMGLLSGSDAVASTGTGAYVITLAERPVHDPAMRVWCNLSALPAYHVVEAATLAAGVVYRWFNDQFYAGGHQAAGFEAINAEIVSAAPGAGGVIVLPHFTGAGAPRWAPTATGVFHGLGLATSRADLARAVLEGIAAEMAENLALMEAIGGAKQRIMASGGLTRFPEFNRILASMTGRQVLLAPDAEASATGAWISAARRLGWYPTHAAALAAARRATQETASDPSAGSPVAAPAPQPMAIDPEPAWRAAYASVLERRAALFETLAPLRS